jgi:myosin heavy subunit
MRQGRTYTAHNRSGQERLLLIEHPVRPGFILVDTAKPAQTARDVYRFELPVPAGKTGSLTVTEEQTIQQAIQLGNSSDDQIRQFLQSPVLSAKMKRGLEQALKLRLELADTQRELTEQQRQLQQITEDQSRLRANLKEMPTTAKAYKRYLEKFDTQESQIEALQDRIKKLQAQEAGRRKQLDDFLANLTVE